MYKRKINQILTKWKQRPDRKPIIIKGVRQCGKTFSVTKFAKDNYKNVIYLDFFAHPELKDIFDGPMDIDRITRNISMAGITDALFEKGNTCIVFDEIQDCPKARTSLKYFALDGRYDVICTGSLLGVNGYNSDAPIPVGYEQIVDMYPMDFEEWLWANGIKDEHISYLKDCLEKHLPVDSVIHQRMRELLQQYIIVGGMPAAVKAFFETNDIREVRNTQLSILEDYRSDMVKYASPTDKPRIVECFNSIPSQLSREYKKFTYSSIKKGARGRNYEGCLQWIEDAGIVRRCYNTEITELPLDGNALRDEFKIYMADTGLFVSMLEDGTAWSISQGNLYGYKGAIFENLLADVFSKMGRKLYYYHKNSGIELDFLIRYKGKCVPVECKASDGNAKSLRTVLQNQDKYHVNTAIKIGDYNIALSSQTLVIPHYLAFLLIEV